MNSRDRFEAKAVSPLCSDIPVYEIKFKYTDKNKYELFKKLLFDKLGDIDLTNKIKFNDITNQVYIFYYPRILKAIIDDSLMLEMEEYIDYDKKQIRGNFANNPYMILNQFLTPEYKKRNESEFKQLAKKWDEETKDIKAYVPDSKSNKKIEKVDHLPEDLIINLTQCPVFGIGEDHSDINPGEFILDNLSLLAEQGEFRTICLEGIPQEAQPLLDQFLSSPKEKMSKELEYILNYNDESSKKLKIVLEAKKLKLRVVGLDNQFTYLADESHDAQLSLRIKSFNYAAYKIINENKKNGKCFFLCGSDHLKYSVSLSDFGIPGIASLLSCPGIVIIDNYDDKSGNLHIIPGNFLTSLDQLYTYIKSNILTTLSKPIACDVLIEAPKSSQRLKMSLPVLREQSRVGSRFEFWQKAPFKESLYSKIAKRVACPEVKLPQLDKNLNLIIQEFLKEDEQELKSKPKHFTRYDSVIAYQLKNLMCDPEVGLAYTALLLAKYPKTFSPGSWANAAKISIDHARLILDESETPKEIINDMIDSRFLANIAEESPQHASFILEKFEDKLGNQREIVDFFSKKSSKYQKPG